jgi:hypothetical protein
MSFELVSINCREGDAPIQHAPFLRSSDPDPRMQAFIQSYNATVEQNIEVTAALNSEKEQAQEQEIHVSPGSYNCLNGKWDDEIEPVANTEAEVHGAGEYDQLTKMWK